MEKINRLYQSMTLDEKNIDVFEQDLMLSYTRQLHAAFSNEEEAQMNVKVEASLPKARIAPKAPAPKAKAPVVKVVEEAAPPPPPPPVEVPVAVEVVPEPIVEVKKEVPAVAVKVEKPAVKVEAPKPPASKVVKVAGSEDQEALFEQEEVTDLSGKLGQRPVKDLNKAMGLNEKILTINELFGGDQTLFADAMKTLNGFGTFEEAKIYLTNGIAAKYDWAANSRSKKARIFINLIRRRYNK